MTPRADEALDFLERWRPGGPWVLVAIAPDRSTVVGKAFVGGDDVKGWLLEQDAAGHNVYFHVNPLLRQIDKKAQRQDVASVDWLHVDVDPRPGEALEAARQRARDTLMSPPVGVPPPTVVVFSGGGYQGFWRLEDPIQVGGDLAKAEKAKLYNLQLERLFRGDNCHNIDRIMRLPGTVNYPNAYKRSRGQEPVLARVELWDASRVYPLAAFEPAQVVMQDSQARTVDVGGDSAPIHDLDELDQYGKVESWVKSVILHGHDLDDPHRLKSRSEWQHAVSCALVRAGVPDAVHYKVLTDPLFKVSASVLDKGLRADEYAKRQILRAREAAETPELAEMNGRHAVVANWGGKCRVMEEVWDPSAGRHRLTKQTFEDVRNRYCNRKVQTGVDAKGHAVYAELGAWWLKHQRRRQYDAIVFEPGKDAGERVYNLWSGFAYEARPGGSWALLDAHIRDNMCRGNDEHYRYLVGWMAHAVQRPDRPGYAAVVLRGEQGVGKGFWATAFGRLFGRHFMQVSSAAHVVGPFNAHLRDVVVLFADEAFYAGDKRHRSSLKTLITESNLPLEGKGVDLEQGRNCVHLIMASNDDWVVGAERGDRRYFVLDVAPARKEDRGYFRSMEAQLEAGGYEAMLHYLMSYDLSKFDVRDIPKTDELRRQQTLSLDAAHTWWLDKLHDGRLIATHPRWDTSPYRHEITTDFSPVARTAKGSQHGASIALGRLLRDVLPEGWPRYGGYGPDVVVGLDPQGRERRYYRPRKWLLPTLAECRAHWELRYGPQDWPPEETQEETPTEPF